MVEIDQNTISEDILSGDDGVGDDGLDLDENSPDELIGGMDVVGEDFTVEETIEGSAALQSTPHALELLQDINLDVVVELGRTRKPLRDILAFTPGNVIELNSMVGDSVDVLINDRLIAKGEVVAFEEQLGVRITSIVTPEDLIKKTMK
ncbi:flagellar motor switch protein FliN [Candidatus Poribacteria bacterium]|nr:flagellar motor switch protein FliN [Candidatus Poribacteria bacterium]